MTGLPIIRRLGPEAASDFRTIRLAALASAPEAFGSTLEVESARPLTWFADRAATTAIFGAYTAQGIAGMAGFVRLEGLKQQHKGFLWGMFVQPAARRQGIGAALVSAVLDHAVNIVEQVTLTVVTSNLPAIALYRRLGFEAYGIEPRALKSGDTYADEILMIRYCGGGD